jgi:phytol kinase
MPVEILKEVGRKIIHIIILIALLIFFAIKNQAGQQAGLLFLSALMIIFLAFEYMRLDLSIRVPFMHHFLRPKDQHKIHGVVFFISSTIITLAVFDTAIALAALLMTAFGDMAAAIAGKKYGTTMLFRNKTVVGFSTELITNLIVGILISLLFSVNIYILIIMAFAATLAETLTDEIEDNLVVPIISGFIGQILILAF